MSGSLYGEFAAMAQRRGDAPALSGSGRTWTYAALHEETERLAQGYEELGLRPGDRVAIFSSNHAAIPLLWLAAARSAVVCCTINFMLKPRELSWILERLGPRALVVGPDQLAVARESLERIGATPQLYVIADEPIDGIPSWRDLSAEERYAGPLPSGDDVIEVCFTSGTTRNPKGAVFTNAAHLYSMRAWIEGMEMGEREVVYTVMPLFHAGGLRNAVLVTLLSGGHVIIGDSFHASTFWKECCELGVTQFTFVETILALLLLQEPSEYEQKHKIRVAIGPAQHELLTRAEERFNLTTVQGYGMTEISLCCLTPFELGRERLQELRAAHPEATFIGAPLGPQTEVRLVDDDGNDVAEGEIGEFWMRSPGMLREYLDDPEATEEFLQGGWIHSGDLGIQGPGQLRYYIDRKKDMIRRGGENFAPREVEDVLLMHPKIADATVVPVPDPIRMQEAKAIVVAREGETLTADSVWAHCSEHLAEFKVPRYVELRASIPRNATGRVQKHLLREEPLHGQGQTYDRTHGGLVPVDSGDRSG